MTPVVQTHHKTDAQIFAAVRHALDCNPAVPDSVRVHVNHGIVALTGSVRSVSERDAADQTARTIEGVLQVANDIFVLNVPAAGFEPPEG